MAKFARFGTRSTASTNVGSNEEREWITHSINSQQNEGLNLMTDQSGTVKLLQSVEEISGAWVQKVLMDSGIDIPDILDVSFKPIGNGNTNETYKLDLTYASPAPDAPETLIIKIHSSNPDTAQRAGTAGVYKCEHKMSGILDSVPDLLAPRFYHSAISNDGYSSNIVMDDLSQMCEPGDQITGLSEAQALAAVEQLLKLHLHFWQSEELETIDWMIDRLRFHHEGAAMLKDRLAAVLTPEEVEIFDNSLPIVDKWLDHKPEFSTFTHADCRADNILFKTDDTGEVSAYIIDWATCTVGDAMADIAYLLVSSMPVEKRAACEEKILSYCAEKIQLVEPGYTLAKAKEAYRNNIASSMFMTMLAGLIPPSPHAEKLLATLVHRNCAALKDWA